MKTKLLLILIFAGVFVSVAQSKKVADKYFNEYAYPKAANLYEGIYNKGDESAYIINRIADSYYKNAETSKSEYWYAKLFEVHKSSASDRNLFNYAQSLRANGNYKKSDSILAILDGHNLKDIKEKTEYLLGNSNEGKRISIRNIATNTQYSDFGGFVYDDVLYFASSSPRGTGKQKKYKWNNQPFLNLYKTLTDIEAEERNGEIDSVYTVNGKKVLPSTINTQYHESNVILTKDGKTMYFTRVNSINGKKTRKDKKKTVNLKLYRASLVDGKWSNIYELPFNSDQYSVGHPALTDDEKILYFTSDMPGSVGGADIFKVEVTEGGYGKPVNLGSEINTPDKEMFPFVGKDNTLYFSSNGHVGLGLMDIFQSKINDDGTYTKPVNLEKPFNSKRDDFNFYIAESGKKGFFSSNREGGKGDDDIYSFFIYTDIPPKPEPKPCTQLITGVVTDVKTGLPIASANVKLINKEGQVVGKVLSGNEGQYRFEGVPCSESFSLTGDKLDHKPDTTTAETTDERDKEIKTSLKLRALIVGDKIVINPIYFDFNKDYIREDAQYELEDIVMVMQNHPNMVIKIESHTDSRGSKSYNRNLSDRRAKSTRKYLLSRGITTNRIQSAIGYGEDQLLNHCDDAHKNKCTEEEHQLNRRSYFIIVSGGDDVSTENKSPTVIDRKPGR